MLPPQEDSYMNPASALSQDECRKIVKNHFQTENVEAKSFTLSPLNTELSGFMGDYLKLRVSASLWHQDTEDATTVELQFFVKSMPLNDAYRRHFAMSTLSYQKEVLFFGHLLRDVRKHLRCAEWESCRWLGTVPRCYYLRTDLFVLEDLSLLGFRTLDPLQPLTLGQCEGVLRAVARLHGASLVYEEREGRRLADAYPLLLQDTLFCKERGFPLALYEAHLSCIHTAHLLLDLIPSYTNSARHNRQLHRVLDSVMEEIYELLKPNNKYRNVLCHRDLTVNNLMFAHDAKGEVSVRLVDLQTLHLEPPAHDVMIFLQLCTVSDMRRTHGRRLQMLYHQTLAEVLSQHDLDIDSILPLHVFLQSCEDAKHFALVLAAYTLQVTMLPLATVENCHVTITYSMQEPCNLDSFLLDRRAMVRAAYINNKRFRDRMTETMQELVETCLIPRMPYQRRDHAAVNGSKQQN